MRLTVRHKEDGAIYYISEHKYRNSKGLFILVNEEKTIKESKVELPREVDMISDEERVEQLREKLRKKGIVFHPNSSEKTLIKKLNGGK